MVIQERLARDMMKSLGFANADSLPAEKLAERLNNLQSYDTAEPGDDGHRILHRKCLEALEAGEEIKVNGVTETKETEVTVATVTKKSRSRSKKAAAPADSHEGNGSGTATATAEAPSQPKKGGKAKKNKPAKEAAERDRWGSRLGSGSAKMNAAVSKKAKTVKEMADETGISQARVYSHMRTLMGKGLVERTDDGKYKQK